MDHLLIQQPIPEAEDEGGVEAAGEGLIMAEDIIKVKKKTPNIFIRYGSNRVHHFWAIRFMNMDEQMLYNLKVFHLKKCFSRFQW